MSINQIQLRLSIDGQQALSTLDAVELKQQNLISSNKDLSDARNLAFAEYQKGLLEIVKLQEKQAMLDKQMAVASESGKLVQLTRMEAEYEANATKLEALFNAQHDYNTVVRENDIAIAENNKLIKANNKEIETLIKSEGDLLRQDVKLLAEKKAMNREIAIASNGSERQQKAFARLAEIEKELTTRSRERAKATADGIQKIIKEQGFEKVSTQQLIDLNKYLENANKHRVDRASADAQEEIKSIKDVNKELSKRKEEIKPDADGGFMSKFKDGLPSAIIGGAAGALVGGIVSGIPAIVSTFSDAIDSIKKRARDITDIEVALNTTREKATKIKSDLNSIKTESSVDELKKLVVVAGDLNVAENDIKAFVEEADKVAVVLGSDFGGNAEEAIEMIAKLKGEFKDTRDLNYSESLAKIGSTLKQLNLDGPASTRGITDFLKRVGAIPDAIKPTLPQLAAFGAVFEEANLSAEIAGSGFSKILSVAANNASLFGKQMGMTKKEIENLINTDPNSFVIKFAQSLKGLSGTDTAKTLKSVRLESDEVLKVVGILTDNIEKLTQKQQVSNQTFSDGIVTTDIFNKYLDDEAGKIAQIEKAWSSVGASVINTLAKISGPTILWLANMAEKGKSVEETFLEQTKKTAKLEATLPGLISKYQDLTKDGKLSADAQRDLNKVMSEIGGIVPSAISEFDKFGKAMSINLGIVNEFVKKQKEASNKLKNELSVARRNEIVENGKHIKAIQEQLRTGQVIDYEIGNFTKTPKPRKLTDAEIKKNQQQLAEYQKKNKDDWENYKLLYSEKPLNATTVQPPETPRPINNSGLSDEEKRKAKESKDKAERLKLAEDKYLQEKNKHMIELQAKLAFEEKLSLANEEQKKILQLERKAEQELEQVRTQFKDKNGLIIEFSKLSKLEQEAIGREEILIQKTLAEEKLKIQQEYIKKQDDLYEQHANRAIQIFQDQKKTELEKELQKAKNTGKSLGIFNAEERIINNDQVNDKFNETVRYLKEQNDAKGNAKALELIEENHKKALELIQEKYQAKRDQHITDANDKDIERTKKANLEKLRLDVDEANAKGNNPQNAQFALLDAQMNAELSVKDLTELEKTNILRKYALERSKIEDDGLRKGAEKAISYFQDAFGAVTSIFSAELQNRTNQEQNAYDTRIRQIDTEKERGIITSRQQAKAKILADKEHDTAQRKLKREQFQLDKAANIANIIMTTALSVMAASVKGFWEIAPIVGLGAVQLGIAASQQMPAYAVGGFPESIPQNLPMKKPSSTSILSWLNEKGQEYVVPNWQLNDPVTANLVDVIEHRRKNKIVGHAEGGFASETGAVPGVKNLTNSFSSVTEMAKIVSQFGIYVHVLTESLKVPITAQVNIGQEESYQLEQERTKMLSTLNSAYANTNQSLIN